MGKCCVVGAESILIDERNKTLSVGDKVLKEGDWLTLEGGSGKVFDGKVATIEPDPGSGDFADFMSLADKIRRLKVRANADIPRDAQVARKFGAEGIGLCRTEHMFFAEDRLPHVQEMILANTEPARREALNKLLPFQRSDFEGLFHAMDGLPVTIRLLDPPLHEFLPKREELMVEVAVLKAKGGSKNEIAEKEKLLAQRLARREQLEDERKSYQAALTSAETRLRDTRNDLSYRGERLTVIDTGVIPERPSSPNLPLNVAVAVLLGLLFPLFYLALALNFDPHQSSGRDVLEALARAHHD